MGTEKEDLTGKVWCSRLKKYVEVIENTFPHCPEYTGFSPDCGDCALVKYTLDSICIVLKK